MILKATSSQVLLVRPGATEFDDQGRMKGSLDIPMSLRGREQVSSLAQQMSDIAVKTIYTAPGKSAQETAERIAEHYRLTSDREVRVKVVEAFRNIDHGLWHGKLIDEVRRTLPKVYRQGQETPDEICPPEGESIRDARARVIKAVRRVVRKHKHEVIAIVVSDPMAWVVAGVLTGTKLADLWNAETDSASYELIDSIL